MFARTDEAQLPCKSGKRAMTLERWHWSDDEEVQRRLRAFSFLYNGSGIYIDAWHLASTARPA